MVYPLLDGGEAALSEGNFGEQLRVFVASFDRPNIHFVGAIDKRQLAKALTGFGAWSGEVPTWKPVLVTRKDVLGELRSISVADPRGRRADITRQ